MKTVLGTVLKAKEKQRERMRNKHKRKFIPETVTYCVQRDAFLVCLL
jgi:hypothetical protein